MPCSHCREAGHTIRKCPIKAAEADAEAAETAALHTEDAWFLKCATSTVVKLGAARLQAACRERGIPYAGADRNGALAQHILAWLEAGHRLPDNAVLAAAPRAVAAKPDRSSRVPALILQPEVAAKRASPQVSQGAVAVVTQSDTFFLEKPASTIQRLSTASLRAACDARRIHYAHDDTKAVLAQRIQACLASPRPVRSRGEPRVATATPLAIKEERPAVRARAAEPGAMSKAAFRKLLALAGTPLEADQDVFHIIAQANGGSDHIDNYHGGQSMQWNRAIGANHDNINCFMAGQSKAKKAVAVSRRLGNVKGKKYSGPSWEALCLSGANAMRGVRLDDRNARKDELTRLRRQRA